MSLRPETERRSYAEFLEFDQIVQRYAAKLGIVPGTEEFNQFGLAMNAAVEHGRFEALESLVK